MTEKPLRVGIIGTGRVGVFWHLPDIRQLGGEVTALADSVPGRAARHAAENKVPHAFDDWRELIRHPEVDIVAICTPPVIHEEQAVAALRAGKPVYLEKPPAMNATEMERIVAVARETGQILLAGSNSIYYEETRALKRHIEADGLGHVYYVEALKTWRRAYKRGWHRSRAVAGGGVGMDSSPHRLDLAFFLLNNPRPVSVTARTYDYFVNRPIPATATPGYLLMDVMEGVAKEVKADVEDTLIALIQFESGATMLLRDTAQANMPEEYVIRFFGTKGGASLSPLALYGEQPDGIVTDIKPHTAPNPSRMHLPVYRHLFDCVREGRPTLSSGERAVTVMRVVDAVYESAKNGGREVRLDRPGK
jgi:predicted dehydrogenase